MCLGSKGLPTKNANKKVFIEFQTAIRAGWSYLVCWRGLQNKWKADCGLLPLTERHKDIYKRVHRLYWLCFGTFPNLVSGETYNEKIQWLKIFGQDPLIPILSDKLALKKYVAHRLGHEYVPRTLQSARYIEDINFSVLPSAYVLKVNHDSGSVLFVNETQHMNLHKIKTRIGRALRRSYGRRTGEWQYWPIERKVFVEELLPFSENAPPADFKFHCANGRVIWMQYLFDRGSNTKEVNVDREGKVLGIAFDLNMTPSFYFTKPKNWRDLVAVAEKLSDNFPYVRVDLYSVDGRILVGELTFTPLNSTKNAPGNELLGRLIPLNRSLIKKPISPDYLTPQWKQWAKSFSCLRSLWGIVRRIQIFLIFYTLRFWLPLKVTWHRSRQHGLSKPLIVSLTSYPPRFQYLSLTLRCLLCQTVKADKLILWIAEEDYSLLPSSVLELQHNGLIIQITKDMKPYKKLIPAINMFGLDMNYVIADDDMYYPKHWLETLLQSGEAKSVVCHFSREWLDSYGNVNSYKEWPAMLPAATSKHGLLIGNGGVWFPPKSLGFEACNYNLAKKLCPLQDDIWFSWHVLMRGFRVKRAEAPVACISWPGSNTVALSLDNNPQGGGNDVAIDLILQYYGMPEEESPFSASSNNL